MLTYEQMNQLLEGLSELHQTMLLLDALAGLRRCELFALRRMDVDLEHREIHVRQRVYNGQMDSPKSTTSIRDLLIPPKLAQRLQALLRKSSGEPSALLFPGKNGRPLSATTVMRRVIKPALKKLGLPDVSWHSFRRTLGTWLRHRNAHVKTIKEQLGHANPATTLDLYIGSVSDDRRAVIDEIEGQLSFGPKRTQIRRRRGKVLELSA